VSSAKNNSARKKKPGRSGPGGQTEKTDAKKLRAQLPVKVVAPFELSRKTFSLFGSILLRGGG